MHMHNKCIRVNCRYQCRQSTISLSRCTSSYRYHYKKILSMCVDVNAGIAEVGVDGQY